MGLLGMGNHMLVNLLFSVMDQGLFVSSVG